MTETELRGNNNEFAFQTLSSRLPIILTQAIDHVYQSSLNCSNDKSQEASLIISKIAAIKYQMTRNAIVAKIHESYPFSEFINILISPESAWFDTKWLTVECLMYNLLHEAFHSSTHWSDFDVFSHQKQEALLKSRDSIIKLLKPRSFNDTSSLVEFIQYSLWGNQCDLSLNVSTHERQGVLNNQATDSNLLEFKKDNLIVSDLDKLVIFFSENKLDRIDIILDNSGFELFTDLLLADFFIKSKLASKIVFHCKTIPWFVSDVTIKDFKWSLREISRMIQHSVDWNDYIDKGVWVIEEDPFWTLPHSFHSLNEFNHVAIGTSWKTICKESDLVIFKGDLNYRKLLNDYPGDISFKEGIAPMLSGDKTPAILALRTCKSEQCSGLKMGQAQELDLLDPDWRINGKFGLIQFHS